MLSGSYYRGGGAGLVASAMCRSGICLEFFEALPGAVAASARTLHLPNDRLLAAPPVRRHKKARIWPHPTLRDRCGQNLSTSY